MKDLIYTNDHVVRLIISTSRDFAVRLGQFKKGVFQSQFIRNVVQLSGGTAVSQAILISSMPVITRLYRPDDFGILTLYLSIVSLTSIVSTLRYEQIIILTKTDRSAAQLLRVVVVILIAFGAVAFLLALFLRYPAAHLLGADNLAPWLLVLPISLILTGAYQALRFWTMRMERFHGASLSLITRVLMFAISACVISLTSSQLPVGTGLIIASIVGDAMSCLVFVWQLIRYDGSRIGPLSGKRMIAVARRHRVTAGTLTVSQGIGMFNMRLPELMISAFFGPSILGSYNLAERVMAAPSQLISQAVADVYRQRGAMLHRDNGNLSDLLRKTLISTALLALVPYGLAFFWVENVFELVLGSAWKEAGYYSSILLVGVFFSFVVTPIGSTAYITGSTRFIFWWNFSRMLLKIALIPVILLFGADIVTLLWALVAIRILMYVIELIYCVHVASETAFSQQPTVRTT